MIASARCRFYKKMQNVSTVFLFSNYGAERSLQLILRKCNTVETICLIIRLSVKLLYLAVLETEMITYDLKTSSYT